jgi:hypothetical protein
LHLNIDFFCLKKYGILLNNLTNEDYPYIAKKPLNLLIDEELVKKARDHGLIISKFLENKFQEYLTFINAVSYVNSKSECGRRDLNPSYKLGKLK